MKFKDAPIGARFYYPTLGKENIYIKLNSFPKGPHHDGKGEICSWNGNVEGRQSFYPFVDEENGITFETEIELL